MADITRLQAVLTDYHDVLAVRSRGIREAYTDLVGRYRALAEIYEGRGAAEFKAGWAQVDAAFDAYGEGVPQVLDLLTTKIEQLRRLDEGL